MLLVSSLYQVLAGRGMEVDPPPAMCMPMTTSGCTLKRSNSAPMINVLTAISSGPTASTSSTQAITINTGLHRLIISKFDLNLPLNIIIYICVFGVFITFSQFFWSDYN